jgi:hypothetical protein
VTLEELAAARRAPKRDCRTCAHFQPDEEGLAFGWCGAHEQFVKLYHPPGQFWSQCQFLFLREEPVDARRADLTPGQGTCAGSDAERSSPGNGPQTEP